MQHFGKHEVAFFKQESWSQKLKSGKTEAEGFFFFHVNALTNANKVLINLLDGWQLLTQQQQPDVITAFCVFFLFLLLSLNIFSFFFYMERNKEQHLARTCAVFFKRRLEQTWFCGTLGNRSERLSSGKLWANINEAFKLEKEKNTHPFLKKKKVWAAWRPAAEQRDRNIFYQQAPPTPPTLRGHRLIGAERQWQLGLMEPTTRKKKKTHCGWEGDVSVRFNLKGFNKSGRIGGRQRQCGLSVFTLTSASSRRVRKKKKKRRLVVVVVMASRAESDALRRRENTTLLTPWSESELPECKSSQFIRTELFTYKPLTLYVIMYQYQVQKMVQTFNHG